MSNKINTFLAVIIGLLFTGSACAGGKKSLWEQCIVLAEQARHGIVIVEASSGKPVWIWDLDKSGLAPDQARMLTFPTEVKPIYNSNAILVVSNDAIGIIRIADHKVLWYCITGGGFPHSAEILPDGNIAVACSTSKTPAGDKLKIFVVDFDNFPATEAVAEYPLKSGHNAVWDRKNKVLWATAFTSLNSYTYSTSGGKPSLTLRDSLPLPEGASDPHDLFPAYGQQKLWLTTHDKVYLFDTKKKTYEQVTLPDDLIHIKSITSGPKGFPVIMLRPTEMWWSNIMRGTDGSAVFTGPDYYRIYKGRWLVDNTFSYPKKHRPKLTK